MNQQASAHVTAADISRLAGVTRATVSNWRRRHPDFPAPAGGTDTSPTYDLDAVRAWLSARGQLPEDTPADRLRTALRTHPGDGVLALHLLPVVLAAARLDRREREALPELRDDALLRWVRSAADVGAQDIPGTEDAAYAPEAAEPLRALLRCVVTDGAEAATDVLAERLLEDTGGTGTYLTPRPLAALMARLLTESAGAFPASVLDPACGTGSLLAAAASAGASELHGQDVLVAQAAQAAVRLRLNAPEAAISVHTGDSLRSDAFKGLTADAVLCNPPYGVRDWGHDDLAYDQRWAYGVPPKGEPELAWVQHCLAHLTPRGRAVLLMPPAVAERTAGRRIRAQLVRDGALRAVVSLPQGAATPLHIGLHLWVLERPDPQAEAPGTVLLVDAAAENRDLDWVAVNDTVLSAWRAYLADQGDFTGAPGTAAAMPVTDLLDEAVDLTPARRIRTASRQALRPALLARQASELYDQLRQGATDLVDLSTDGDWPPADDRPRDWRTATVADLLRGGALSLLHTAPPGRRTRSGQPQPQPEAEPGPRPALTAADVFENRPASGTEADLPTGVTLPLVEGSDVLLTEILRVGRTAMARVVEPGEAGCFLGPHLLLFRPDRRRLDPWFLAGFLAAEQNVNAAATGTSLVRVDPRRLRVPLLPLAEQQRYGAAFRRLHELRTAARRAEQAAEDVTRLLGTGLTDGALLPDGHGSA
ncbi:N-6 DNA methylase [Streptomyces bingchenggensis BCW-1]|uniref:N-6 DNA methylase n=1 Tax=Streptomyces bingchenggensis (strain BCW-1) TaxID=749414 RepID=D7CG15_STRBB|nr:MULTISPECIES: N-6 DNA methylase [Streptomyces]ADI06923.1 N-6 DNA methylase [Streptomyces bingchenggensis BCW-1]